MITILDFAKLALYVYKDHPAPKQLAGYIRGRAIPANRFTNEARLNGMHEVIVNPAVQAIAPSSSSFYASCFVKVKQRKAIGVVIAIRGTVPSIVENDAVDIKSWWRSVFDNHAKVTLPEYFYSAALMFYRQVQRFARDQLGLRNDQIYITGHSLGGAVAALLPTKAWIQSKAVTFNAPGIRDIPEVDPFWHRVVNFRSSYDFVSALDAPIGPLWNINVPEEYAPAHNAFAIAEEHKENGWSRLNIIEDIIESADFLESCAAQHSMANLLQAMQVHYESIDSESYGMLESKLELVLLRADNHPEKLALTSPFATHVTV